MTNARKEAKKKVYNDEPVFYCKSCMSLAIKIYGESTNYCNECGSTKTANDSISNWEKLYKDKYGKSFIKMG